MVRKSDEYIFQEFVVKMWSNQENRVRKQVKNPCEARKIKASQNLHKIISTHLLTVLIMSVILRIEQKINGYLNIDKYPFVKEERV